MQNMAWDRVLLLYACFTSAVASACAEVISPKVLIVTFFDDEGSIYLTRSNETDALDFTAHSHRIPLADPQFPDLHCTADYGACLVTTGEAEIHATATTMALLADPALNLSRTYWVLTGIAGGAPDQITLNSVALAQFSVQAALQYELDARELPSGFDTGYFPQGSTSPAEAWGGGTYVYDTEVFEVSAALRDAAAAMIDPSALADSAASQAYRDLYASDPSFGPGSSGPPTVAKCDVATSDVWFTGSLLAQSFAERVKLWTNGTGTYCTTAQEDGAVAGALVRGALEGRADYTRIVMVRAVSDFDRPYPGQSALDNLLDGGYAAYDSSLANVYLAGHSIAVGIMAAWDETFAAGLDPGNYVGDVWGVLGNGVPDFGPGRESGGSPVQVPGALGYNVQTKKRGVRAGTVATRGLKGKQRK
ncbi:purine nucleoside permease [Xylariales sp. PMI_506]|nr:purine nucleoside permease [Xylariales sp. PMI_506]